MKTTYEVVIRWEQRSFEDKVNERLSEGWELVGGVSAAVLKEDGAGPQFSWSQAMILNKE